MYQVISRQLQPLKRKIMNKRIFPLFILVFFLPFPVFSAEETSEEETKYVHEYAARTHAETIATAVNYAQLWHSTLQNLYKWQYFTEFRTVIGKKGTPTMGNNISMRRSIPEKAEALEEVGKIGEFSCFRRVPDALANENVEKPAQGVWQNVRETDAPNKLEPKTDLDVFLSPDPRLRPASIPDQETNESDEDYEKRKKELSDKAKEIQERKKDFQLNLQKADPDDFDKIVDFNKSAFNQLKGVKYTFPNTLVFAFKTDEQLEAILQNKRSFSVSVGTEGATAALLNSVYLTNYDNFRLTAQKLVNQAESLRELFQIYSHLTLGTMDLMNTQAALSAIRIKQLATTKPEAGLDDKKEAEATETGGEQ